MKTIFHYKYLLLFFGMVIYSCQMDKKAVISGIVASGTNRYLYLYHYDFNKSTLIDSAQINRKGKFKLKINTPEPAFYILQSYENDGVLLLIEPGDDLSFFADYSDIYVTYDMPESASSKLIKKLDNQLFITRKRIDSLLIIYESIKDEPLDNATIYRLDSLYLQFIKKQRDSTIAFVLRNSNSLVSIYALFQKLDNETYVLNRYRDLQYFKICYDTLSKYYPGTKLVETLGSHLKRVTSQYNTLRLLNLAEKSGTSIPELRLPDSAGDTVSLLETIKGNHYTLLSFWASWDEPSVQENLELLKAYEKYHARGLEIYQVSLDFEKSKWIHAIQYDALPWINVSDLSYPASLAAKVYNINALPANYLINDKGEIVAKNLKKDRLWEHLEIVFADII